MQDNSYLMVLGARRGEGRQKNAIVVEITAKMCWKAGKIRENKEK